MEEFTRLVEENKDIESLFKVLSDKYGPTKADAFLVGYIFGCAAPGMAKMYHPEIIEKQAEDPSLSREGMNAVPTAIESFSESYMYLGVHEYLDGKNKICALQYQLSSCLDT